MGADSTPAGSECKAICTSSPVAGSRRRSTRGSGPDRRSAGPAWDVARPGPCLAILPPLSTAGQASSGTRRLRGSLDGSPIPPRYPRKPVQARHGFSSRGTPQSGNAGQHGHPPGEGESYGEGLRESPMNAPTQGILGDIIAWKRPDTPSTEHKECLLISRSAIESSERPTAVVGRRPSGKSRSQTIAEPILY